MELSQRNGQFLAVSPVLQASEHGRHCQNFVPSHFLAVCKRQRGPLERHFTEIEASFRNHSKATAVFPSAMISLGRGLHKAIRMPHTKSDIPPLSSPHTTGLYFTIGLDEGEQNALSLN